ncbi:MAG: hypothetical protein KDJ72_12410 [Methyloceanibacter sp.]|uniref:hypothetical protein n=1 Tax=Methyloceanibacter sp. TaxID=1965321 RepID=UPI001E0B4683|nr:hypothetical protein [Methyloceanibacter sp.]MCB1443814.1 hypothetical protein [Methyloceanibacter sp.]MCC0058206.1 hypothetical protein [Hyphomicrobiaceae bacterium]
MLKLLSALTFGTALLLGVASMPAASFAQDDDMSGETMSEEGMTDQAPADDSATDEAPADDSATDEAPAPEDPIEDSESGQ